MHLTWSDFKIWQRAYQIDRHSASSMRAHRVVHERVCAGVAPRFAQEAWVPRRLAKDWVVSRVAVMHFDESQDPGWQILRFAETAPLPSMLGASAANVDRLELHPVNAKRMVSGLCDYVEIASARRARILAFTKGMKPNDTIGVQGVLDFPEVIPTTSMGRLFALFTDLLRRKQRQEHTALWLFLAAAGYSRGDTFRYSMQLERFQAIAKRRVYDRIRKAVSSAKTEKPLSDADISALVEVVAGS